MDQIFPSMKGPLKSVPVLFPERKKPQLLWITAVKTEVIDSDTQQPVAPDNICHGYVVLNESAFKNGKRILLNDLVPHSSIKIWSVTQGYLDAKLPPGFGIPVWSTEPLTYHQVWANFHINDPPAKLFTRMKITYVKDESLKIKLKPLIRRSDSFCSR